ncbi:3-dehydroquinate synthase [Nanoarchaeota archaeon]
MEVVNVNLKKRVDNSYPIYIGSNLTKFISSDLKKKKFGNQYLIISCTTSGKLFGKKLLQSLRKKGLIANLLIFKEGEQNKNLRTYSKIIEKVNTYGLDRKSAIIALGGGIPGDVAGLVAATYMRGINFIQIPTTLLAMVDSSIGGKVGVDLKYVKNAAGAFHHPKAVYIDTAYLKTLPPRQLSCGLAEVIKYGVIYDEKFFNSLDRRIKNIRKKENLIYIIKKSCKIKSTIVQKDEFEENLRVIVNYGHTVGHAIESLSNYRSFNHGEAISIGMNVAARISNLLGLMSKKDIKRQNDLIVKAGLPIKFPKINTNAVINELHKDKKAYGNNIVFTLPEKIGKAKKVKGKYRINVDKAVIKYAIEECR